MVKLPGRVGVYKGSGGNGCSVPVAPWDGGVKSTHPDRGTHVVKLPGGVGSTRDLGENGDTTSTHPLRTLAISGIAPEGAFALCDGG